MEDERWGERVVVFPSPPISSSRRARPSLSSLTLAPVRLSPSTRRPFKTLKMASPPSTTPSGPPPPPPPPHSAALKIDPESTADVQSDLTLVDAALALGSPFAPESSKGGVGERRAEEERVKDRQITVLLDMYVCPLLSVMASLED